MKNSANVLVLTILTCGAVRSYGTYYDQNFPQYPVQYQQKYPRHGRSPDTAYKWDLPEILNPPPIYDYSEEENKRYPKEIPRSPSHGNSFFSPEFGFRKYPGDRFEYPSHPHLITPQEYWLARDSKNWPHDDGAAFPYPDPEQFKLSRFPFSPPKSPPDVTSSPLSEMKTQSCIKTCPSTPEYNPVCGTNGVTYDNPGKLECAKYCGVDVALQRGLPCNQATSAQPPTDIKVTMGTQSPMDTQPPKDILQPIVTTNAPFESKPTRPPNFAENDPFADRLVFVSTESPDTSQDFDIDIRSRNLKPDDDIVFED